MPASSLTFFVSGTPPRAGLMDARRLFRSDSAARIAREGKQSLALCLGPEGMLRLGWAIRLSRPSPGRFFAPEGIS